MAMSTGGEGRDLINEQIDSRSYGEPAYSDAGGTTATTQPSSGTQQTQQRQQQPSGYNPNDPAFQSLPRHLQKGVESGEFTLAQATQRAQNQGYGAGNSPVPQASNATNSPATALAGSTPGQATQQTLPSVPTTPGKGPQRLSAGQVLEGGRQGVNTFQRAGTQGFRSFAGQEFNPFLLRPEATGAGRITAQQALETGAAGRQFIGGGGGAEAGGQFVDDLLR